MTCETVPCDGRETRTWYRQQRPLERLVVREEIRAEHGLLAETGQMLVVARSFEHELRPTPFGTHDVVLTRETDTRYELGFVQSDVTHHYAYTPTGGLRSDTECADGICLETVIDHRPDDLHPQRWLVNRPASKRLHHAGQDYAARLVLAWEKYGYDGEDLVERSTLVCETSTTCHCFDSPDASACIANGTGRWVADEHHHEYDEHGNLTAVSDALGRVTSYEYDQSFSRPTAESMTVDVGGAQTELRTERRLDSAGRVETETDANHQITAHVYDVHGRRESIAHPGGLVETWSYLDSGTPGIQRTVRAEDLGDGRKRWRAEAFDGWGDVTSTRMTDGDGGVTVRLRRALAGSGRRTLLLSDPHTDGANLGSLVWLRINHDGLDRVQSIDKVRGAHVGQGTMLGAIERRHYFGGLVRQTNGARVADDGSIAGAEWSTRTVHTDSRGRVTWSYDGAMAADYHYDDDMRLYYVSLDATNFPGQANGGPFVYFAYDSAGRVTWTQDLQGYTHTTYDDVGNRSTVEDADGAVVAFTYDALDRVLTRDDADGQTEYTYDIGVNGRRRLGRVDGPWGSESFAPFGFTPSGDPLGRVLEISGVATSFEERFDYDADGRIREKQLPDGTVIEYAYDRAGQLREVAVDGVLFASFDDHDPWGNPGLRITPASQTTYDYNADHLLREVVAEPVGSSDPILAYRYDYDARGNIRGITDIRADLGGSVWAGSVDTEDTWTFDYDIRDQLVEAQDHEGNATRYRYSPSGDITKRGELRLAYSTGAITGTIDGDVVLEVGLDATGKTATKSDLEHDWEYAWNGAGLLRKVRRDGEGISEYAYDWAGRQIRRVEVVGGESVTTLTISPNYELRSRSDAPTKWFATRTIDGLGHGVIATMTDDRIAGVPKAGDVYGGYGGPMIGSSAAGQPPGIWFLYGNHLGSTSVMTDIDGEVVARYRNDPWGVRVAGSTGYEIAEREYTGQRRDESTALLDYGARYYDPALGRFLSADTDDAGVPYRPKGLLDLVGLNRHAYVRNNPVRSIDPTGHDDAPAQSSREGIVVSEFHQDSLTDYDGEEMTVREANRRIAEKLEKSQCGLGCAIDKGWKRLRGKDAELKLELSVTGEAFGAKLEGVPLDGKVKLKDDNLLVDNEGASELKIPLVIVDLSGGVSPDGKLKAKIERKLKGTVAGVGGEAGVGVVVEAKSNGDGTAKVQPSLEVGAAAKLSKVLSVGVKLKVKDGSTEVLPDPIKQLKSPFTPRAPLE